MSLNSKELKAIVDLGNSLGYVGDELKQFVNDERIRIEKEKEKENEAQRAFELEKLKLQNAKEMQEQKNKAEEKRLEIEVERAKAEAEEKRSQCSTIYYIVRNCCKGDVASQWEIAIFGHLGL